MPSVRDFINLAKDEVVIREYHALRIIFPFKLDGNICLTNKRAILYGKTQSFMGFGTSQVANDIHMDVIKGAEIFSESGIHFIWLVIGIILAISGFTGGMQNTPSFLIFLGGLALIALSILLKDKGFYVNIKGQNLPILGIGREKYSIFTNFMMITQRGRDADALIRELGALILDIQMRGEEVLREIKK
jgi:hypothetical protein